MHSNNNKGVFIPYAVFAGMEELDAAQIGKLVIAIIRLLKEGKNTSFCDPECKIAWAFIRPMLVPPGASGG